MPTLKPHPGRQRADAFRQRSASVPLIALIVADCPYACFCPLGKILIRHIARLIIAPHLSRHTLQNHPELAKAELANEDKRSAIHEAKTNLSRLIHKAARGQEVIISRGSKPVARLVPVGEFEGQRKPGSLKGKLVIGPEFFEPLPAAEVSVWG